MTKIPSMVIVLALLASGATAQFNWSDGFEVYNLGTLCSSPACGNPGASGGWAGWDNVDPAAGLVVDATTAVPSIAAHSGSKFFQIGSTADAVQPFSLNYPGTFPTSGIWEISAWTYVPTGGLTATTWFIVNNVYNHLGPYNWALQLQFTPAGVVTDVDRGGSVPVVFDQWKQVKVLVDLGGNAAIISYDGQQVSSGIWTVGLGPAQIANIDLFTGGTIFYDDLSVLPASGLYQTNSPQASLDLSGLQAGALSPAISNVPLNAPVTLNISSTLTGNLWDMGIILGGVQASYFTTANNQIVNIDLANPSLFFFNSGTAIPNLVPFPGNLSLPISAPPVPLTLSAQMVVVDPGHPDLIRLSQASQLTTVACANPENFDSATPGSGGVGSVGTYPVCWSNGGGNFAWQVFNGLTPSANTGPDFDHTTGTGNYVYCETSQGAAGSTFIFNAPASQPTTGTVSFWYHMFGATTGTLSLEELQGGTWVSVWTLSGNQGNAWLQAAAIPVVTNPTSLRFHYTRGTSFTGDTAIDDFQIN